MSSHVSRQRAEQRYVGQELELFAKATHWKNYIRHQVSPFLGAHVLEVGAGLGGTTRFLCDGTQERWICLEPDASLAGKLQDAIDAGEIPPCCESSVGTLTPACANAAVDTVLYIDVLEHIENDAAELRYATRVLRPGGHVVVLSPAHQWLFTPFDEAIGHFRRYTKRTLSALTPSDATLVQLTYLDSVGLLASLANRLLLRSAEPTHRQIQLWDKGMVRTSRLLDPMLGRRVGKSVLGVWRKKG
jgi:2-polyprenyl-3-methyl-5-hydroxy-6-metoxy-1,4-benzoquinol methylase